MSVAPFRECQLVRQDEYKNSSIQQLTGCAPHQEARVVAHSTHHTGRGTWQEEKATLTL